MNKQTTMLFVVFIEALGCRKEPIDEFKAFA